MKLIKWFSLENRIPIKKPLLLVVFGRSWVPVFKSWLGKPTGRFWASCKLLFSLLSSIFSSLTSVIPFCPPLFFPGRQDWIAASVAPQQGVHGRSHGGSAESLYRPENVTSAHSLQEWSLPASCSSALTSVLAGSWRPRVRKLCSLRNIKRHEEQQVLGCQLVWNCWLVWSSLSSAFTLLF